MNPKILDLTGQTFCRLTVLQRSSERLWGRITWDCVCSCGVQMRAITSSLRMGNTRSCGCLQKDAIREHGRPPITHGMSNTPTYRTWTCMMDRCYLETHKSYPRYGGAGIKVAIEWHTFEGFYKDMGVRPPGKTLDRIDNDKGYEPGNCRWATRKEQANNCRSNKMITFCGKTRTVSEWADKVGLHQDTLGQRLKKGWSVERALMTPLR